MFVRKVSVPKITAEEKAAVMFMLRAASPTIAGVISIPVCETEQEAKDKAYASLYTELQDPKHRYEFISERLDAEWNEQTSSWDCFFRISGD